MGMLSFFLSLCFMIVLARATLAYRQCQCPVLLKFRTNLDQHRGKSSWTLSLLNGCNRGWLEHKAMNPPQKESRGGQKFNRNPNWRQARNGNEMNLSKGCQNVSFKYVYFITLARAWVFIYSLSALLNHCIV